MIEIEEEDFLERVS